MYNLLIACMPLALFHLSALAIADKRLIALHSLLARSATARFENFLIARGTSASKEGKCIGEKMKEGRANR